MELEVVGRVMGFIMLVECMKSGLIILDQFNEIKSGFFLKLLMVEVVDYYKSNQVIFFS